MAEIEADLCTNRVPILSSVSALSRFGQEKLGKEERWGPGLRGGPLSQVQSVSYGGDMQGCFCVCALRFHTLTQACTDPLSVCLFGPCQTVYNISPLQESASDEQMLCTDSRRWRRQCKVTLPDKYGSRPLLHHEAVKPTGPSHLSWSLSDMPGPTLTQVHDFTLQHTTNLFNF